MKEDTKLKIEKVKSLLVKTNLQDRPGSIIYSGDKTLQRGDFYFLGQNPGGNDEKKYGKDTILNQLMKSGDHNEYTQGVWSGPKGKKHQEIINKMFKDLELDIESVFSTNLNFLRSSDTDTYVGNYSDDCKLFWSIHEYFLSIVRPKFIIANGSEAREYFKKKMKPIHDLKKKPMKNYGKYKHIAQSFRGSIRTPNLSLDPLTVLAIPHLSNAPDYNNYYKKGVLWLKNELNS